MSLIIGVFFDLGSAFYHMMTMLTGKYMSGFPLVGLLLYAWFVLAYRSSLVGCGQTELGGLLLCKAADVAVLASFHALCQLPMLLQGPRSKYK